MCKNLVPLCVLTCCMIEGFKTFALYYHLNACLCSLAWQGQCTLNVRIMEVDANVLFLKGFAALRDLTSQLQER